MVYQKTHQFFIETKFFNDKEEMTSFQKFGQIKDKSRKSPEEESNIDTL